jgi:CO/xanthine dehydrogenase Mo-binding subunit
MTEMLSKEFSRTTFLKGGGALIVGFSLGAAGLAGKAQAGAFPIVDHGQLDSWLTIDTDGHVTVRSGRVDQGQGKQTSYAQIVAEELDVAFDHVHVILGDTGITPNQGKSTATDGIRIGVRPVRNAAVTARQTLLGMAATQLAVPVSLLTVSNGVVSGGGRSVSYGELIGGKRFNVTMTVTGPTAYTGGSTAVDVIPKGTPKDPRQYKIVGTSPPRVDIPAKVRGTYVYTQSIAVPGMLHARVVLPPTVAGYPRFTPELVRVKGFKPGAPQGVQVIQKGSFVAVVAESEWQAIQASSMLEVEWKSDPQTPNLGNVYELMRRSPRNVFTPNDNTNVRGNVDAAFATAAKTMSARYDFPQTIHGLIGPSVAVASYDKSTGALLIWAGSQNLVQTRVDVAQMLGIPLDNIRVIWSEQASMFGRGGVDDAAPAAAILSYELGKPVRVQWMRSDEHVWGPQQPGNTQDVKAALDSSGRITAWQHEGWTASAAWDVGNSLPAILIGKAAPNSRLGGSGLSATAYAIPNQRSIGHTVDPPTRPMYFRTVAGIQNAFTHESFMDELAAAAGTDPIEFRLRHLTDTANPLTARGLAVLGEVQRRSGWVARTAPSKRVSGDLLLGRGVALSMTASCCIANVADVAVNRKTGAVSVTAFWSVAELGTVVSPDGTINQIHGGTIMSLSRALKEQAVLGRDSVKSRDWVTYPILRFKEVPTKLDVTLLTRPNSGIPDGGIGEPSSVIVPAAVGNAIFDATGIRMRQTPFTPARVRAALKAAGQ